MIALFFCPITKTAESHQINQTSPTNGNYCTKISQNTTTDIARGTKKADLFVS